MRPLSDEEIRRRVGAPVAMRYKVDGEWKSSMCTWVGVSISILVRNCDRVMLSNGLQTFREAMIGKSCFLLERGENPELASLNLNVQPASDFGDAIVTCFDKAEHFVIFDPEDKTYFVPNDPAHPMNGCDWTEDAAKAFRCASYGKAHELAQAIDVDHVMKLEVLKRGGGADA